MEHKKTPIILVYGDGEHIEWFASERKAANSLGVSVAFLSSLKQNKVKYFSHKANSINLQEMWLSDNSQEFLQLLWKQKPQI